MSSSREGAASSVGGAGGLPGAVVAGRLTEIHAELSALEVEIDALESARSRLLVRLASLQAEEEQLRVAASPRPAAGAEVRFLVGEGLRSSHQAVMRRGERYEEARQANSERIDALLRDSENRRLVSEFEQYLEVEPTLDMLPSGYRSAIVQHHDSVKRRLQPVLSAIERGPDHLDLAPVDLLVLASADPDRKNPDALVVLTPAPWDAWVRGAESEETMPAMLAWRLVAILGSALGAVGAEDAPITYFEVSGCLGMQVWLGELMLVEDVGRALEEALERLSRGAHELEAVQARLDLRWVDPEALEECLIDGAPAEEATDGGH